PPSRTQSSGGILIQTRVAVKIILPLIGRLGLCISKCLLWLSITLMPYLRFRPPRWRDGKLYYRFSLQLLSGTLRVIGENTAALHRRRSLTSRSYTSSPRCAGF